MSGKSSTEETLTRALGVMIALGALAVGAAAAVMNNERSKQMRDDMKLRVDELGKRVDDLSSQAKRTLEERRPEIEDTINRSRQAAVEGLEKVKTVVEQGSDKAQEYVQRMSQQGQNGASEAADKAGEAMSDMADEAGANIRKGADEVSQQAAEAVNKDDEPTRRIDAESTEGDGQDPLTYNDSNNPAGY